MNQLMKKQLVNKKVSRISISLAEGLLYQLDEMVMEKGFENRSQALSSMIHHFLTEHKSLNDNEVMAGTINLVYDYSVPGLQKQLVDLQHNYISEVISSLHVNLMNTQTMEVILVQGPGSRLQEIADRLQALRGVISARLQLAASLMPPLHPLPAEDESQRSDEENRDDNVVS